MNLNMPVAWTKVLDTGNCAVLKNNAISDMQ